MKKNKSNSIKIRFSLIEYCERALSALPDNAWEGRRSNGRARILLSNILSGKELVVVKNCNGHSYPLGVPIPVSGDIINNSSSLSMSILKGNKVHIDSFTITALIPGNNTVNCRDIIIEDSINIDEYIQTLNMVKEVIDSEIEMLSITKQDESVDMDKLTIKAITSLVKEPFGTLNLFKLNRIIDENETNSEVMSYRREIVSKYK